MSSYALSEIAEIVDCEHKTAPTVEDSQYRSIRTTDIANGKIHIDKANRVSENTYLEWSKRAIPEPGDIILAREAPVGEVGWIAEGYKVCLGQRTVLLKVTHSGVSKKFLLYYLANPDTRYNLQARSTGSVVAHLNVKDIRSFTVSIPPLPEQKAIAYILSSLDDKIDLLHRQNKTLEALAETLFRQWFVEEAQEDWEEVALEDITNRITDGAHASPPTVAAGVPMASVKDMYQWGINTSSCRQISQDDFDELVRTDCRPLKNDILIAKDGSYLKHVFVVENDMDVVILSSIAILRPNGKYHPLLLAIFLKLESTKEGLENIVTGAVIPRIVLKDFRKYKLPLPPKQLQDQALACIQPIYEKCWENGRKIRTLETLRDTLLPKLMSGEVRVVV
ncbi:restriction endonuclease subunit S [Nitrosomonas oligotropha]|uniref:Type I restriction enzyme, S subunit n=1 Tax=Nitrosomonas oligotropha TaxID=42354 RepID=A0A1H8TUJ6_9PROT|nr:restriction endonuclease subunit S [Nitrosomonas oligotropha]SDX35955.1 type I restriction enzyme, S subunit [Nitrosomonas oligotropha]SEO94587.1 type I restriction enzyme, S subunit [Nitrosomonas oligotropha]